MSSLARLAIALFIHIEESSTQRRLVMTRLVVVVPAIGKKTRQWSPLIQRLKMEPELAQSDWRLWDYRCGYFSFKSAMERARELAARIEETWNTMQRAAWY